MKPTLFFFADTQADHLQPLTLTRPVHDLRLGLTTIREKWEQALGLRNGLCPLRPHLRGVFPAATKKQLAAPAIWVNARYLPTPGLANTIRRRSSGSLRDGDDIIAAWSTAAETPVWFAEGRPLPRGVGVCCRAAFCAFGGSPAPIGPLVAQLNHKGNRATHFSGEQDIR